MRVYRTSLEALTITIMIFTLALSLRTSDDDDNDGKIVNHPSPTPLERFGYQ